MSADQETIHVTSHINIARQLVGDATAPDDFHILVVVTAWPL